MKMLEKFLKLLFLVYFLNYHQSGKTPKINKKIHQLPLEGIFVSYYKFFINAESIL